MNFRLIGFSHAGGLRLFKFRAVAEDNTQSVVTVSADLAGARTLGIQVQQLPLLCTRVLEHAAAPYGPNLSLTASDMRAYAADMAAAAGQLAEKRAARSRQCALAAAARLRSSATGEQA